MAFEDLGFFDDEEAMLSLTIFLYVLRWRFERFNRAELMRDATVHYDQYIEYHRRSACMLNDHVILSSRKARYGNYTPRLRPLNRSAT